MTQFSQAMAQFSATHHTLPHFVDAMEFSTRAHGSHDVTLALDAVDIGAMMHLIAADGTLIASHLAFGDAPLALNLTLSRDGYSETLCFTYCGDAWHHAEQPMHVLLAQAVRFSAASRFTFTGWTLDRVEFADAMPEAMRQAA
jgi:hypothetical protein